MNRVHIKTYGCQMNERDSESVAARLRARGYAVVEDEVDADIVLLNTCSVRDQAEQKAIGKAWELGREDARRARPRRMLGILGCMAQNRGADLLDRLPDLDLIVGTQKIHRVPDFLDALLAQTRALGPKPATLIDLDAEPGSQNAIREHASERKVCAFVSVMQGCDMRCAYCIVPRTRGAERARPPEDIVREVEELVANGTREVTLLGQIVNRYGAREFPVEDGKSPFVRLLERLHEIPGLARIRYTSPHPVAFRDDLAAAHRDLPKLCPQVNLPLQAGSDRILRAMNRAYTADGYRRIVRRLREARPDLWFSTDIIVGFPGETDEDFEQTRAMFEEVGFDMAYVFKYSVRSGTPAEPEGDPVPADVKEVRNQILLELLEKQSLRRHRELVGSVQEVLVEGAARKGDGMLEGRTPGGRKTHFAGPARLVGELVRVRITGASVTALAGEVEVVA